MNYECSQRMKLRIWIKSKPDTLIEAPEIFRKLKSLTTFKFASYDTVTQNILTALVQYHAYSQTHLSVISTLNT